MDMTFEEMLSLVMSAQGSCWSSEFNFGLLPYSLIAG